MSNKIKYILSLWMAFNILIASVGINVFKHSCQTLQTTSVSAFSSKEASCCCTGGLNESSCSMPDHQSQAHSKNTPTSKGEDDCCKSEITPLKAEVFTSKLKINPQSFIGVLPVLSTSIEEVIAIFLEENTTSFTDSSPPLTGRQQVILYQAFLL